MKKNNNLALILVDSRAVGQVVASAAQGAGYAVQTVETRSEACDVIRDEKPALMVAAMKLPEATGVLHEIGTNSPGIALVMVIDEQQPAADMEFLAMAAGIGTAVAVHRPIRMRDLISALEKARPARRTTPRDDDAKALETAIDAGEITVDFLPRVLWQGGDAPTVVGCEASASWQPENGAWFDQKALMCRAQRGGFSDRLIRALVEAVGENSRRCDASGRVAMPVLISMPPSIVHDQKAAARIAGMLREEGLSPGQVIVKISEPAATADPAALDSFLSAMAAHAIPVALANFGASQICVPELAKATFSEVVLDANLVAALHTGERARRIVQSLVAIADSIGFDVCADGVDSVESARFLVSLGCNVQQGRHYHVERAMICAPDRTTHSAGERNREAGRKARGAILSALGQRVSPASCAPALPLAGT